MQRSVYANMTNFVAAALSTGTPQDIVLKMSNAGASSSGLTACGARAPAVIFDIDETVILNLGYERYLSVSGKGYSSASWLAWERTGAGKVAPVPGVIDAMAELTKLGVTPVFVSDRSSANAAETINALSFAGVARPTHMHNLFLKGDVSAAPGKDARRAKVAELFCVVALVGDQLGDFSDALVKKGRIDDHLAASGPWGRGWFLLPNPVYGSGVRGNVDAVMPPAFDWQPLAR